jgi:hydrogenase maturation protein HypF
VAIGGAVQGVGFRPFIYRLAAEHGLQGWVVNSCQGVTLEVEGPLSAVQRFLLRIEPERPPRSFIQSLESVYLDPVGYTGFEIRPSDPTGERTALVLPDVATCAECVREVFDPGNRRFGYPFTNCTHCGPRYSIIAALPYDRPNTSMKMFRMCEQCQAEYENPRDRRFHAQPNACPVCGPRLEWWDRTARPLQMRQAALLAGVAALRAGQIVAVKGLGGFHLMVDAGNEPAVTRLRRLKHREEKPFALLFPSLAAVRAFALVSDLEERALRSPEAPIVLLRRRAHVGCAPAGVCAAVAPDNPWLGIMLPYTPLHHLLLARLGRPVVATSGNLANEPICTDEHEAVERLGGIADWFLVHNRPILRHVDDSIVRVVLDRELVLRRARGYAPLPIPLPGPVIPTLAVGAHLKNTVALGIGRRIFLSQHIGDLEGAPALAAFTRVLADLPQLYASKPEIVAADAHPDYLSTQQAETMGAPVVSVQHHYAHVLACMAENALEGSVLGVSWDGAGYGPDQTVWGGEFLRITPEAFERVGHLRQFRLPGGDKAVEEPRRSALGLLYELFQAEALAMKDLAPVQAFTPAELQTMGQMLAGPINAPLTSSAGRLFDAVASLTGLRQEVRFEGQAALDLEFSVDQDECQQAYPVRLLGPPEFTDYEYAAGQTVPAVGGDLPVPASDTPFVLDWSAMVQEILHDLRAGLAVWVISAKFHNALTEGIVAAARRVREPRVVLSGGCFQNKYLLEQTVRRLREEGFGPYWHQRVPPNDGGVALGQVIAAARSRSKNRP